MILSLRTRLLGGIIIATAVLLGLFSVIIYSVTRQSLIRHFDVSLLGRAQMLSAMIEEDGFEGEHEHEENGDEGREENDDEFASDSGRIEREIDFEFDVGMIPEFNHPNGGSYYQFWSADGKALVRSPSLAKQDLKRFAGVSTDPVFREMMLPDKKRGRAISYPFLPRTDGESTKDRTAQDRMLTLVLAQNADALYGHLDFLKWLLVCASVGVVFLSAGAAYLVTRTGLRPVHSLAGAITAVREDNLGLTFSSAHYPAELAPICDCLNDVFRRIERSFKREKQFNANVAHELRTPLAGMQSTIEVCLTRERAASEYREAFNDCLQIAKAMHKMIDTLLMLSKLDAGQITIHTESVELNRLVDEAWRFHAEKAHDKRTVFDHSMDVDAVCRSDKDRLGMIISNLLENAVEYTDDGGRIWTHFQQSADGLTLSVFNNGCELTPEDADHLFDFFWRKSSARTDAGRHCGIGLSVARKVAAILGVKIVIDVQGSVFAVHLTLPV